MNTLRYWFLVFIAVWLLQPSAKAIESSQNGQFIGTGSGNLAFSGMATGVYWQTVPVDHFADIISSAGILYNVVEVGQTVRLDYDRGNKSDLAGNSWQVVIGYTITDLESSTSESGYLTVSDKNYTDIKKHPFISGNWKITINSVNTSGTLNSAIESDIHLLSSTDIKYHRIFTAADLVLWPSSTFAISSNASEASITWNTKLHAEGYELQYVFIDEKDDNYNAIYANSSLAFDHPEASAIPFAAGFHYREPVNVTVTGNSYTLNYTYPKGLLAYRVRALGRMMDNSNVISYGGWSTVQKHDIIWNFEPNKLWQSITTFAEDGKHKEVLSYYDGTMRNRQSLTNLSNGTNVAELAYSVVAETKYDHEGRAVFSALPAPIPEHIAAYQPSFNRNGTVEYSKSNFDKSTHAASDPLSISYGTGKYYSANVLGTFPPPHTVMMNYVPDAEGYAYSQVEYMRDGTGRVRAASGVGPDHQLGSGKETKYYYANANDTELKRLFGSNVGVALHYKKNYTVDPNGQVSVSYLDQEGRTIATALAGATPSNLIGLESNQLTNVTVDLLKKPGNNIVDKQARKATLDYTFFNAIPNTSRTFKYSLDGVVNNYQNLACKSCQYKLKIYILDEDGDYVKLSTSESELDSIQHDINGEEYTTCEGTPNSYESEEIQFTATFSEVGNYRVYKELSIGDGAIKVFMDWLESVDDDMPDAEVIATDYISRMDSATCYLTCKGAFEASCGAELSATVGWDALTGAEKDELVEKCINEKCAGMISRAIDTISKAECESYREQMRQSIQPDRQGVLDYVWWAGGTGHSPPFTITNGTETITLDEAALADSTNFKEWYMDALVVHHREYCHYDICINRKDDKIFEKQLAKAYTLAEAQDVTNNYGGYNFYNIVRGNNLDSLKQDPFFADLSDGNPYADDMQDDLLDFKGCTTPVSMEDYFAYSTTRYPCQGSTSLTQTNAETFYAGFTSPADDALIAERHWQLMRSTYIDLRNKYMTLAEATTCPFETDANTIVKDNTDILPTTQAGVEAFADEHFSNHVGSTCMANVTGWRIAMVNKCSDMTDQQFNDNIAPHLYHYCMTHGGFDNPLGLIFADDTLTDLDLIAVQTYLETSGWEGCDTNILSLNPYTQTIDGHVSYDNGTTGLNEHPTAEYGQPVTSTHTIVSPCFQPIFDYINTAMWQNGTYAWDNPNMPIRSANLGAVSPEALGCMEGGHVTVRMPTDPEDEELVFDLNASSEGCSFAIVFLDASGNLIRNVSHVGNLAYNPVPSAIGSVYYNVDTFTGYNIPAPRVYPANCAHNYAEITADVTRNGQAVKAWMYLACFEWTSSDNLNCATGGACCPVLTTEVTETIAMGLADTSYNHGVIELNNYVDDCLADLADIATYLAYKEYEKQYIQHMMDLIASVNKCFDEPFAESFTMNYDLSEYHYTLYYYDQAGLLVQTVPPEGVDVLEDSDFVNGKWIDDNNHEPQHRLRSRYSHNSLDAARWQQTPDAGESRYWYDWKGMLKMSQNAKQQPNDKYSFTKYDRQGRITTVGEVTAATVPPDITRDMLMDVDYLRYFVPNTNPGFMQATGDYTLTLYDRPVNSQVNTNVRGRVAFSLRAPSQHAALEALGGSGQEYTTQLYGYDIHGNVNTFRQRIPVAGESTVRYRYDLISGKVNSVAYHDGNEEIQLLHRYAYDADNRLRKVETSRKGLLWHTEAEYWYYPHGPLARVEIGEDHVQGLDYYYTVHGWLKGINSLTGTAKADPGADGTGGNHSMFAPDQYGLQLGYYDGDYTPIGSQVPGVLWQGQFTGTWSGYSADLQGGTGLYNGNIAWQANAIGRDYHGTHPFAGGSNLGMVYRYDQLNRIKQATGYETGNGTTKGSSRPYGEDYSYDANGNIKTLVRRTVESNTMDNLTYNYDKEINGTGQWLVSNKLYHYSDAVSASATAGDLENTAGSFNNLNASVNTANNFGYDEIGNLVKDESEEIADITWDTHGKIKQITRINTSTKPDLLFLYSPTGERALKVEMTKASAGVLDAPTAWNFTGYMRDASGNVMNTIVSSNGPNNKTDEFGLYGSSRLGVWNPNVPATYLDGLNARGDEYRLVGDKMYELTNHLGNVMVVVGDKKLGYDNNSDGMANTYHADVISMNDYYAFGMPLPGRTYSSPTYRYGFNGKEKDDETYGVGGTSLDFGARIYNSRLGRWLSIDPLQIKHTSKTSYHFCSNNPLNRTDRNGKDDFIFHTLTYLTQYQINGENKLSTRTVTSVEVIKTNTANTYTAHNVNVTEDYINNKSLVSENSENISGNAGKYLSENWGTIRQNYPAELYPQGQNTQTQGFADAEAKKNNYEFNKKEDELRVAALSAMLTFVPIGEFLGLTTAAKASTTEMVTVGRWMSKAEYEIMSKTGKMIEGAGGQTFVGVGGSKAFDGALKGAVFAEFQVPANSLLQAGRSNWFKVIGPNANETMKLALAKQGGKMLPEIKNLTKILDVK